MMYQTRRGRKLSEEQLKEFFRDNSFVIFNERDYENWKNEKIATGVLKIAE